MKHSGNGKLFILSAPSGTGKTTLGNMLREKFPDLLYSISSTTRDPRPGEKNGVDYYFISKEEFEKGIAQSQWAEWAKVHDYYYGTSRRVIEDAVAGGEFVLLDIDVQGAKQIMEAFPSAISIFIEPPSMDVLRQRLVKRGTDAPDVVAKRMKNAIGEMGYKKMYKHVLVNDSLDECFSDLVDIVLSYGIFGGDQKGKSGS